MLFIEQEIPALSSTRIGLSVFWRLLWPENSRLLERVEERFKAAALEVLGVLL